MTINGDQVVAGIVVAAVLWLGSFVYGEVRRSVQHKQNTENLVKLNRALGLEDPNDVAFMRASDGRRIESLIGDIVAQLGNGKPGRFALAEPTDRRLTAIENSASADHGVLRDHSEGIGQLKNDVRVLRRDVDELRSAEG